MGAEQPNTARLYIRYRSIVEPFRCYFQDLCQGDRGIYLFSPLIALFVLNVLRRIIVSILVRILV